MATNGPTSVDDAKLGEIRKELEKYAYVRFVYVDLHGIAKHRLIPARHAHKFLKNGTQVIGGIISVGPRCEVWFPASLEEQNFPNCFVRPDLSTLRPLAWTGEGAERTGIFLCETYHYDGRPEMANPRYVARTQLARLDKLGYRFYSAFEYEFSLLDKTKPVFEGCDYGASIVLAPFEPFFRKLDRNLRPLGVDLECIHTEHGPGYFETPLTPSNDISGADHGFLFKQTVKELAEMEGWQANFMAKMDPHHDGCGAHFNFSVWEKDTGRNAFFKAGANGQADGLSDLALWWIAGIMKHMSAICALCCPTINCYRRLHQPWAPDKCDWNVDDRTVSLRAKCYNGETGTYMENRLPSGLANPYLVLAATVAAGLDGLHNRLTPPAAGSDSTRPLPYSLAEALDALEADKVISEALGDEFMEWFVGVKRAIELKELASSDPKVNDAKALAAEFDEYGRLV